MSERICAVVVTYNRLKLLKECIEALRNQSRKLDEIIIVNNDSQDGTKEWLDTQDDLTKIHQENQGGAGGFHNGIKAAYEKGYDWIWCMDDDCLPEESALNNLISIIIESKIIYNSLILENNNQCRLAFGLYDNKKKQILKNIGDISGNDCIQSANFFNGTLISKEVIKIIGFPNPNFFIYGDEFEYYLRAKEFSLEIITIPDSIIRHPIQKCKYIGRGKNSYRFNYFNNLRLIYYPRNRVIIFYLRKDFSIKNLLKICLFDLYGLLLIQKSAKSFFLYLMSIIHGFFDLYKVKNWNND